MHKIKILSVTLLTVGLVFAAEVKDASSKTDSAKAVASVETKTTQELSKARKVDLPKTNWSKIKDLFM